MGIEQAEGEADEAPAFTMNLGFFHTPRRRSTKTSKKLITNNT